MPHDRILHLIHTPRHSGAESLVRDLCLLHQQRGIATAIASFSPAPSAYADTTNILRQAGVTLFFPDAPLSGRARINFFRRAYRAFAPDIVYAHSVLPALYGRLAVPWFTQKPRFVSVLHSATNDDYAERKLRIAEYILARRNDEVFAVSAQGAEAYRRRFPFHAPVRLVPNGVNLNKIAAQIPHRAALRERYGLSAEDRLILQVGRISPVKQQALTVSALSPLLQEDPHTRLWLAGLTEDAAYESALRAAVAASPVEKQIRILGSREDIPELLSAADLYVMPSRQEAHSIAMIEALASGVKIAASAIGSFQFAQNLDNVRLFAPEDGHAYLRAARALLADPTRSARNMSVFDMERVAAVYGGYIVE